MFALVNDNIKSREITCQRLRDFATLTTMLNYNNMTFYIPVCYNEDLVVFDASEFRLYTSVNYKNLLMEKC